MIGTISQTTYLLNKYHLTAKKKYGQNFLIEPTIINKALSVLDSNDEIIEIGPGLGSLTEQLALKCRKVTAYEIDEDMYEVLINELSYDNLEIIKQDFLEVDLAKLDHKVSIVSNLPYYITSQLLSKIMANYDKIDKVVVMMQKQVAQRFLATNIEKDYAPLQVISHYYSDISLVTNVNRHNFMPAPQVDSAILCFKMRAYDDIKRDDEKLFNIIKACFNQRRKTVYNNLNNCGYVISQQQLESMGISPQSRVEQLTLSDYISLYEVL